MLTHAAALLFALSMLACSGSNNGADASKLSPEYVRGAAAAEELIDADAVTLPGITLKADEILQSAMSPTNGRAYIDGYFDKLQEYADATYNLNEAGSDVRGQVMQNHRLISDTIDQYRAILSERYESETE